MGHLQLKKIVSTTKAAPHSSIFTDPCPDPRKYTFDSKLTDS